MTRARLLPCRSYPHYENGKIEQVGTPEEIYLHPQTEFAASFVSKCNFVRGQWNDSYFKVMDQSLIYDGPEVAQAFKNHGLFPVRPEQFHIVKEGKGIPATVTNRTVQRQGDPLFLKMRGRYIYGIRRKQRTV